MLTCGRRGVLLVLSVLAAGCGHGSSSGRAGDCTHVNPDRYFANTALGGSDDNWFGKYLCAMGEESLAGQEADEAYRFLWLPSRGYRPVAVRVQSSPAGATLFAVELDHRGGTEPGPIKQRLPRKLAAGEWAALQAAVNAAGFWDMPSKKEEMGLDGAEWVLEGKRGARYHVVQRWSPRNDAYRAACVAFLTASMFSIPVDEVF
jgi:hypothetical protein